MDHAAVHIRHIVDGLDDGLNAQRRSGNGGRFRGLLDGGFRRLFHRRFGGLLRRSLGGFCGCLRRLLHGFFDGRLTGLGDDGVLRSGGNLQNQRERGGRALSMGLVLGDGGHGQGVHRAANQRGSVVGETQIGDGRLGDDHLVRVADDEVVGGCTVHRRPLNDEAGVIGVNDAVGGGLQALNGQHRRVELGDGLILADAEGHGCGGAVGDAAAGGNRGDVQRVARAAAQRGGVHDVACRGGRLAAAQGVGRVADLDVVLLGVLHGRPLECGGGVDDVAAVGFRGQIGGESRSNDGGQRLRLILQREGTACGHGVVQRSVGGNGMDVERVDLALLHHVGLNDGLLIDGVGAQAEIVLGVANLHGVAGHVADGIPAEGDFAGADIENIVFRAGHGLDAGRDLGDRADGIGLHGGFDAPELNGGAGDVGFVAVLGIGRDGERVGSVQRQRVDGNARQGQLRILVQTIRAGVVGDGDVVLLHVALRHPAEGDIAGFGAAVGQAVDVAVLLLITVDGQRGRADDSGLDVLRRVGGVEQLLGVHVGHAGGAQTRALLEELHGGLSAAAKVAGDVGGEVVQLLQTALQALYAAVLVAAAQHGVAAIFGRAVREQALQNGHGRLPGDGQTGLRLELLDGAHSVFGVGVAHAHVQIVQILQPLVQLADASAAVALAQVDVAGAGAGAVGIESGEGVAGGIFLHGEAVFALEQLNGRLSAGAEDAVGGVGQIAQLAQSGLHHLNAQAAVAAIDRAIGIVLGQRAAENNLLKLGVGYAVHRAAQIVLKQADGALGAGAEDAVHAVVIIAQIVQRLLHGAHRLAALSAAQRGQRLGRRRGLKQIPCLRFALQRRGAHQHEAVAVGHVRGELHKGEGGGVRLFGDLGVDVQLAAHGLDGIGIHLPAVGNVVGLNGRKGGQLAGGHVHGVDHGIAAQREQAAFAGGQLAGEGDIGRAEHLPLHRLGVVALQAHGAAGVGDVVDPAAQRRVIIDVGVDDVRGEGGGAEEIQVAAVGQIELVAVGEGAVRGNAAGERLERAGDIGTEDGSRAFHIGCHQSLGGEVQAVELLDGGVGRGRLVILQIHVAQLSAVIGGNVKQMVVVAHAGGPDVLRQRLLGKRGQVEAQQGALAAVVHAEEDQPVGVDGPDGVGLGLVDGLAVSGNPEIAVAVHIGGERFAPHDEVAAAGGALRERRAAQQRHDRRKEQG